VCNGIPKFWQAKIFPSAGFFLLSFLLQNNSFAGFERGTLPDPMTADFFNLANYAFNPYAIPTLATAVAIVALGFIVLVGERNSRVGLSFFIMTVTAGIWLFCYSFMYCAVAESTASTWAFMGQLGITFIPAAVYHFTVGTL
jgi:hypothetical protein